MKIALYTNDLVYENKHLMPWRTVLEVASNSHLFGQEAYVFSGRRFPAQKNWYYKNCLITEIEKPYSRKAAELFCTVLKDESFDVLFLPAAWCKASYQKKLVEAIDIPIVWYVPGAYYHFGQVLRSMKYLSLRTVIPYLIQSLYPKKYLISQMLSSNSNFLITTSEYTKQKVCQAGWSSNSVFTIYPGKPPRTELSENKKTEIYHVISKKLAGRQFYLFMGPPAAIRGINQLLKAFALLADKRKDVCLVCLFRSDSWTDSTQVRSYLSRVKFSDRIFCLWKSVSKSDLQAFMYNCYAVALPFLLVPSEIPLAIIEAAGHSKPVITTGLGGTGSFVEKFGLQVTSASQQSLMGAMLKLLEDKHLYLEKCTSAQKIFESHPTWEDVTQQWLSVAQKAVGKELEALLEKVS